VSDPFLAEVKLFGCNFAPRGWAICSGQLMPIAQFSALFSLLGVNYGGNGTTNFALPNLQGVVPMGAGAGPGLSPVVVGESLGSPSVTLITSEMPAHNHGLVATSATGTQASAANAQLARGLKGTFQSSTTARTYSSSAPDTQLAVQSIQPTGGGQPHNNMMPFLVMNYCIALEGIYPSRN
jgi:microcystin-dependent protein